MTLRIDRRPRFEPLRSATPPSEAQNTAQSPARVVRFSMSPRSSSGCRLTDPAADELLGKRTASYRIAPALF